MKTIEKTGLLSATSRSASAAANAYEAPEMVEIAPATTLVRGIVMTKNYYDCLNDSTTDYQPRC